MRHFPFLATLFAKFINRDYSSKCSFWVNFAYPFLKGFSHTQSDFEIVRLHLKSKATGHCDFRCDLADACATSRTRQCNLHLKLAKNSAGTASNQCSAAESASRRKVSRTAKLALHRFTLFYCWSVGCDFSRDSVSSNRITIRIRCERRLNVLV